MKKEGKMIWFEENSMYHDVDPEPSPVFPLTAASRPPGASFPRTAL